MKNLIFIATMIAICLSSCVKESVETDENLGESLVVFKRSSTVAEEIGHQLADISKKFEDLSNSDKSLFIATANSSMSDAQKENILNANSNTQILMESLVQLSLYIDQQGLNQSSLQAIENDITNTYVDDLVLPAQATGGCEATYAACMTTILMGCLGLPPCVVGGMALCTGIYAACLADSGAFGISNGQYIDTNGNIHPLSSTMLFFNQP